MLCQHRLVVVLLSNESQQDGLKPSWENHFNCIWSNNCSIGPPRPEVAFHHVFKLQALVVSLSKPTALRPSLHLSQGSANQLEPRMKLLIYQTNQHYGRARIIWVLSDRSWFWVFAVNILGCWLSDNVDYVDQYDWLRISQPITFPPGGCVLLLDWGLP